MKSHITVLLDCSIPDIFEELKISLEKHRLDEESDESINAHHWDYWYFPDDNFLKDAEFKQRYLKEDDCILENAAYVRNLPKDYSTSGVICMNGEWVDLQDYGWRMMSQPSEPNSDSLVKWNAKLKELLYENSDAICVQVITHC